MEIRYFFLTLLAQLSLCSGLLFLRDFDEPIPSSFDFIIIGSGSAGSVLANRLSEIRKWKILLIEVGKRKKFVNDIPVIAPALQFTDYNWGYRMEKTPNVCLGMVDQRCPWPRGKGLGGTSLINYMIYTRGNKADFERWASAGNPGWTYDEVLPYYMLSERCTLRRHDQGYHNYDGPLSVEDAQSSSPIRESFIEGGKERGFEYVDYNGKTQDGFSYVQANTYHGHRHSAFESFIRPAELRPNLWVLTEARATKILLDPNTKRAYGVQYVKNRRYHWVNATKEVLLSAGALSSPQLLMLSGVGPRKHLESLQIPVHTELSGVGKNLHDHITFPGLVFLLNETVSSDQREVENPLSFINWALYGKGVLTNLGGVEALGYYRTNVTGFSDAPDIEFIFISGGLHTDNGLVYRKTFGISDKVYQTWKPIEGKHSWSIFPMLMHPKSTGYLKLKSKNPFDWPKFYGNYLSDPENHDVKTFIAAIREIIQLSKTKAFQKYGSRLYEKPIVGCENNVFDSDSYWECALRTVATTLHHQVGTCKMGPKEDKMSVVDNKCRVHGIKNLRVVDTSIIPFAITAHTNAPAYMIGEKIAYEIKRYYKVLKS